mgnify:CR=1 FL=1
MSAHHNDPTYRRNAAIIRSRTRADHQAGRPVWCIGCGRDITPTQPWDVGHRIDAARGGSHTLDNLGPQHRGENRRAGGRLGAQRTNNTNGTSRTAKGLPTW